MILLVYLMVVTISFQFSFKNHKIKPFSNEFFRFRDPNTRHLDIPLKNRASLCPVFEWQINETAGYEPPKRVRGIHFKRVGPTSKSKGEEWNVTPLIRRGSNFFSLQYIVDASLNLVLFVRLSCLLLPTCSPDVGGRQ